MGCRAVAAVSTGDALHSSPCCKYKGQITGISDQTLSTLKDAAMKPGSVPPPVLVKALVDVEKAKMTLPENWQVHFNF